MIALLPAELEDRPAEALADDLADALAHAARAGGRDQRHALVARAARRTSAPRR
jgi:hypothetical protein